MYPRINRSIKWSNRKLVVDSKRQSLLSDEQQLLIGWYDAIDTDVSRSSKLMLVQFIVSCITTSYDLWCYSKVMIYDMSQRCRCRYRCDKSQCQLFDWMSMKTDQWKSDRWNSTRHTKIVSISLVLTSRGDQRLTGITNNFNLLSFEEDQSANSCVHSCYSYLCLDLGS